MVTVESIVEGFEIFKPQKKNGFVELNLPLVLKMNNQCFTLQIIPEKSGFVISDGGYTFENFNNTAKDYFDLFAGNQATTCDGFEVCDEQICKKYPDNTSLIFAFDDFIRFFLEFDNFVFQNHLR